MLGLINILNSVWIKFETNQMVSMAMELLVQFAIVWSQQKHNYEREQTVIKLYWNSALALAG